jgi:hypothetical protein
MFSCRSLLLWRSAFLARSKGPMGFPDNSRFGEINSRLGRSKFPVTPLREFAHSGLIRRGVLADEQRFCGPIRQIPGCFPGLREFAAAGAAAQPVVCLPMKAFMRSIARAAIPERPVGKSEGQAARND